MMQKKKHTQPDNLEIPQGDPTPVLKSMHGVLLERTLGILVDTLKEAPIDHAPRFVAKRGFVHGKNHALETKKQVRSSL
jgi:hypothetical protein